jgi:hypothetical protein
MPLIDQVKAITQIVEDIYTFDYPEQEASIKTFLEDVQNNTIRVFVADAIGMGHQSNTVMIMNRLISLGFNHNFEVIYDSANTAGITAEKLAKLIPGFIPNDGSPEVVVLNANTSATMIALSNFRTNIANYPTAYFGFTGGFDSKNVNLANAPTDANPKGVNVNFFLELQPFQWKQPIVIQRPGQAPAAFVQISAVASLGTSFLKRGYYVEPPTAPTQEDFMGADANKFAPYNTIINACTGVNHLNLLPIYGINSDDSGMCKTNPALRPQDIIFDLVSAVRYIQGSALPNLQRGAIMVVIADVSESCYNNIPPLPNGALSLNILLNGVGDSANATIPNINQFVTDIEIVAGDLAANHVEIISYDNPDLNAKILLLQEAAGANKILIVKMPGLSAPAFEYIYACSSLPCLLEGKNTANLVLNLNKPYLNIAQGNQYPTLPLNTIGFGPDATRCFNAVSSFIDTTSTINTSLGNAFVLNPPSAEFQATPMYKIAQLAIDSYKPTNEAGSLQPYFASLQLFFQNQQQDKLFLSLLYFLGYRENLP